MSCNIKNITSTHISSLVIGKIGFYSLIQFVSPIPNSPRVLSNYFF